MNRYEGKPFLRFLDSYVLDAIGQLDTSQRAGLITLQPTLARALGSQQGTWQEMVREQMDFPESMPGQIRLLWEKYLEHAKQQGQSVSPNEFVEVFIDQNFPDLLT